MAGRKSILLGRTGGGPFATGRAGRVMEIRAATGADAPALGRVMVTSFLAAHRGQIPDGAWSRRKAEWTPEVSAAAWARMFDAQAEADADAEDHVLLVAVEEGTGIVALALGTNVDESSGSIAELACLYVLPDRQGEGIGALLLRAIATELARRGYTALHVEVIAANLPARGFYEAMGGREHHQTTVDEEGYLLPATVYAWPDINALAGDAGWS